MSKPFLTSKEYESLVVELRAVVDGLLTLYAYLTYRLDEMDNQNVIPEAECEWRKNESKRSRLDQERMIADFERRIKELEKRIKELEGK